MGAEAVRDRLAADLEAWPGERFGHRYLLGRAWQLRETVRGWDAMYVALAEALGAVLVTTDQRLASATGPTRRIEVIAPGRSAPSRSIFLLALAGSQGRCGARPRANHPAGTP